MIFERPFSSEGNILKTRTPLKRTAAEESSGTFEKLKREDDATSRAADVDLPSIDLNLVCENRFQWKPGFH